ncbi:hypothetical protein GCM10022236_52710 [Microlunatus ginsengisoli]|uniref:Uncharacterized protein n=2 Tax=Microlunatus ginsengisoli TaxID=363863 RepID=A0ABP7AZS6_9ACTN
MWAHEAFWRLVPEDTLTQVGAADVPPDLHDVVRQGRVEDASGGWLLRAFRNSDYGNAGSFDDLTGFEAAVNGRVTGSLTFCTEHLVNVPTSRTSRTIRTDLDHQVVGLISGKPHEDEIEDDSCPRPPAGSLPIAARRRSSPGRRHAAR